MELCARNLEGFIYETLDWTPFRCLDHSDPLFFDKPPIWWRTPEILHIISQLVNGGEFIHRRQLVHRDLKPQNSTTMHSI
jgi:serine/threonine protein kinase